MEEEIKRLKKILEPRQPKWKMSKIRMPHCPVCKERLSGNNSYIKPYKCNCGEWISDWLNSTYFKIKVKAL